MLEKFKDTQPGFCQSVLSAVSVQQKVSHAYLIETKGFTESRELILAFAKLLLCPNGLTETSCENCHICHLIDSNSYCDFRMIEPDGNWIKKEQVLNLQSEFKMASTGNGRRVYIIFEVDKLNKASANTILKFLEEPEPGIVAILVTKNRYMVLDTIISRCQVLSLAVDQPQVFTDEQIQTVIQILDAIKQNSYLAIASMNSLWYDQVQTKEDCQLVVMIMEAFYSDLMHQYQDRKHFLEKYGTKAGYLYDHTNFCDIIKILECIHALEQRLESNVNLKLWVDDLFVQMVEVI